MKLLLDMNLLRWAAADAAQLSNEARGLIDNRDNSLFFSPVTLWEVAIKRGLGRDDFKVDPRLLHRGQRDQGYDELAITSPHVLAIEVCPRFTKTHSIGP
jgi:PIN domain nuclease of toxin-antitoxin system